MEINFNDFAQVCKEASEYDNVFANFKEHCRLRTLIVEHGQEIFGHGYIREISPELLSRIDLFKTSDLVGNPVLYHYDAINTKVSVSTLFYIKVLSDLIKYFGSLDGMNIVDIGSGYGGQCKIVYDYCRPQSYTLIDLPEVKALSEKYINRFHINTGVNTSSKYDLCISNYAFTEFNRNIQEEYNEKFIQKSIHGYMTCNFTELRKGDGSFSKDEVLSLHSACKEIPEVPLTAHDNYICMW
jgi:hypothetical protein